MPKLRNMTITVEEEVARWARVKAAREESSVSRLVGEMLKRQMHEDEGYAAAQRRALARKPFLRSDGRYLTREEVHDRTRLR